MNETFSISEIINSSWDIVKKNIWYFAGSFFIYMAIFYGIYAIGYGGIIYSSMSGDQNMLPAYLGIFLACFYLILIPLSIYFMTAFFTMTLKAVDGEKIDMSVFSVEFKTLIHVFLGGLLGGLAIYIGLFLCILPGIYLAIRLQFFIFYIIDQKYNCIDAMYKSWERTKGQEMELFVFDLVLMLVGFLGALCCGIGIVVAYPIMYVALALVYRRGVISGTPPQDITSSTQNVILQQEQE